MRQAYYFGCWDEIGHFLCDTDGRSKEPRHLVGFPWSEGLMDTGLLTNGKHPDIYDGKVFLTAGGGPLWLAFFWWDNSVDDRRASNSGFYVDGFTTLEVEDAFAFACEQFPSVVARQRQPLVLQLRNKP